MISTLILWLGRALLPVSLLLAVAFNPAMLLSPFDLWNAAAAMWDEPW